MVFLYENYSGPDPGFMEKDFFTKLGSSVFFPDFLMITHEFKK